MTLMEIGLMGSIFFVFYSAGRFINGYIGDAISPKKSLFAGLTLVAVTNICIGFLPSASVIICLWGINAAAQSMLWGASLRLVSESYKDSPHSRLAAVVLSTSIGSGSLLAIVISSLLAKVGLWSLFAVPGLIVAGICILVLLLQEKNIGIHQNDMRQTFQLLKKKEILYMLFPAFAHGMIKENLLLWAPTLFLGMYEIDLENAALFVFMMPVTVLLGRVSYPVAERMCSGDEKRLSIIAFGFCIFFIAPFFLANLPVVLAAILLALAMQGVSIINVAFMAVHPMRYGGSGQISMVAGLLDGTSYIGSSTGSALFAWIIIHSGYTPMLGVYIFICMVSIGSILPLVRKRV